MDGLKLFQIQLWSLGPIWRKRSGSQWSKMITGNGEAVRSVSSSEDKLCFVVYTAVVKVLQVCSMAAMMTWTGTLNTVSESLRFEKGIEKHQAS